MKRELQLSQYNQIFLKQDSILIKDFSYFILQYTKRLTVDKSPHWKI